MDEARCGAVCPGKFVPVLMFEGQTCSHISGHLPPGVLAIGLNDRTQIQHIRRGPIMIFNKQDR